MPTTFQLDERIEKCRRILEEDPRSQIFAALGEAYRKKGDLERAYQTTKRGLELHPDYGPAHVVMAKIYLEKRLYQEAEKELELAIQLDGQTRATERILAEIWLRKGEVDKAQETLLRLRESGPADESITTLLNLARNLKERNLPSYVARPLRQTRPAEYYLLPEEPQYSEPIVPQPETIHSWAQLTDTLKSFPGVLGALVVGPDGLIVEARATSSVSPELVGPLCLSIVDVVRQNLPRLDFGKLGHLLVEATGAKIWMWSLKTRYLVLWTEEEVNLGSLRMRVSQILGNLAF